MIASARARVSLVAALLAASSAPAYAQLDPLLFLKSQAPNIVFVVDTAIRMQRDAPTDASTLDTSRATSSFYDPNLYTRTGAAYEATLGVSGSNTTSKYRRKYTSLTLGVSGTGTFTTATIQITGDAQANYVNFEAATRLSIARASIYQAIDENKGVGRFGLIQTRHSTPSTTNGQVTDNDLGQSGVNPTDNTLGIGPWKITWPSETSDNGAQTSTGKMVSPTGATSANDVLTMLSHDVRGSSTDRLTPAGNDSSSVLDAPVNKMLTDAKNELATVLSGDLSCRNTVVVLVVGGGEGNTDSGASNSTLATTAGSFLNIQGHRVPVYVIAIAPPQTDVSALQAIATTSGGVYTEITKAMIDSAVGNPYQQMPSPMTGTYSVPEMVRAIDRAIQHAFVDSTDMNIAPTVDLPIGKPTEFQIASPIIGTVNLQNAKDINGTTLAPDPSTVKDRSNNVLPQRSNVIITTAFTLPGFDMELRAFRVYKPVSDNTQPSGWRFEKDGTRLWVACAPGTKVANTTADCVSGSDPSQRNLFTWVPGSGVIALTTANVAALAPAMNVTSDLATKVIDYIRSQPLGAVIDSTPAMMDPPSLDPPPDAAYPGFSFTNKDRRTLIFIGTNRGFLAAIDARTGKEVWAFVPTNLLPKLPTLFDGQSVGSFDFMVDSSPKIADVKLADGTWHTYLVIGEGPGGTFFQCFDVTLVGMSASVSPTDDSLSTLLNYFNSPSRIPLVWEFPRYSVFDPAFSNPTMLYGDLASSATPEEKAVGQSWSDPAIGQVQSSASPYVVLVGSGFLPYTTQQQVNRNNTIAGTTFYMLNINDGSVITSKDVGSDGLAENVDNCVTAGNCALSKNALQSDPVATGPSDSRFISKTYIADLDGRVWRFDLTLDGSNRPIFNGSPTRLYDDTSLHQPIFSSLATVNVGGTQQYIFFGTGSDLLPSTGINESFRIVGVLDTGSSGTITFNPILLKVDETGSDEKVTTFPAVAGDIVFFTTTIFNPGTCTLPTANLYALSFIGGAAYDTNGDGTFNSSDSTLVKSFANVRATAPFIVDRHLVIGTGANVQIFGDPNGYNNSVGQSGVRILSWREVR